MVSDNLLTFAADIYGFKKESLNFISDSTNQIYSFIKNEKRYILRFSERPVETLRQTKAEMDWLYYLAKNGISVSLPLGSEDNELVTAKYDEGKSFIISAFEALPGKFWDRNNPRLWNEKIFYNWGKVTGDIHRLTKEYKPVDNTDVRNAFTGHEALFIDEIKNCPAVYKITEDLKDEIMTYTKDKDSYGLIHYDLHPWNFIIDGEKINAFDFDDSLYGWFALDIGIAIYHGLWWGMCSDAGHDFTDEIIKFFMQGYLSANPLNAFWISKIPVFMKFRQICRLSWFYDHKNEGGEQKELLKYIKNDILFPGHDIKGKFTEIINGI
jgi:Ser/Thr protein kinase RdoA (MazF antagonist)